VTPLTSLVVVIPKNGSEGGVSELVRDGVGSTELDPVPFLESTPLQNKISKLFRSYYHHYYNLHVYYHDYVTII
jgi:hypothetical protein